MNKQIRDVLAQLLKRPIQIFCIGVLFILATLLFGLSCGTVTRLNAFAV